MYRVYRYPFANAPIGLTEFAISPGKTFRGRWLFAWAPFPTDIDVWIGNETVIGGACAVEAFTPENMTSQDFEKLLVEKNGYFGVHPDVVARMRIKWNPWMEHQCVLPTITRAESLVFKFTQAVDYVAVVGEEID